MSNLESSTVQKGPARAIAVFDVDGVVRDVGGSYRRAIADTVEEFTKGACRPSSEDIDRLKSEGVWNNDWEASRELVYRHFEKGGIGRESLSLDYDVLVAFFQSRYCGSDRENWNGYIATEPLLLQVSYLESLTQGNILWGFFSGAPRGEVEYVLQGRLGLNQVVLIGMEDAPGKPDPTGLFAVLEQLTDETLIPVIYVGDTVADMYVVEQARRKQPERVWSGVGILPPHVQVEKERCQVYSQKLIEAGAAVVLGNVQELTVAEIERLASGDRP